MHVGDDQHGGRVGAGEAAQFPGEGRVDPGRRALLGGEQFGVVHEALEGRALEVARVRKGRAPVIGESLEMRDRERLRMLPAQRHDAVLAKCVEKRVHSIGSQRRPKIDSGDPQPGAVGRQRTLASHVRAERLPQSLVDGLNHWPGTVA